MAYITPNEFTSTMNLRGIVRSVNLNDLIQGLCMSMLMNICMISFKTQGAIVACLLTMKAFNNTEICPGVGRDDDDDDDEISTNLENMHNDVGYSYDAVNSSDDEGADDDAEHDEEHDDGADDDEDDGGEHDEVKGEDVSEEVSNKCLSSIMETALNNGYGTISEPLTVPAERNLDTDANNGGADAVLVYDDNSSNDSS